MVGRTALGAALMAGLGAPAMAQSPWDQMFPLPDSCYRRTYSPDHLASHPMQRVTDMTLAATPDVPAYPWPAVSLGVRLRGPDGGTAEAVAYCQNLGGSTLGCDMEGDAGAFMIEPAKAGAVLVTVSRAGIGFETDTGFATLEARQGDDRSFLLKPAVSCRQGQLNAPAPP
jgi:hypothetical protein